MGAAIGISTALFIATNEIEKHSGLDCEGPTTFEPDVSIPHIGRVLLWPQRAIITRPKNTDKLTIRYEGKPWFDNNIWDGHELALCPLFTEEGEKNGYIIQGRNGPPIIAEDLESPTFIWANNPSRATYYVFGDGYYEVNSVNLDNGETTNHIRIPFNY